MSFTKKIDFDNPPVVEVVCGVTFQPLEHMQSTHYGLYWQLIKEQYGAYQDRAPLAPVVEAAQGRQPLEFEFVDRPPLPRAWFINQDNNALIQLQQDRFLHNWRKKTEETAYPRYDNVFAEFSHRLFEFNDFLDGKQLSSIEPIQYELTYVNHIPKGQNWESLSDIGGVLVAFTDRISSGKFLPSTEGIDWTATFKLPEDNGRLYVQLRTALRADDKTPLLQLNLTARGIGKHRNLKDVHGWFKIGHESIVNGFADLTTDIVQKEHWRVTV